MNAVHRTLQEVSIAISLSFLVIGSGRGLRGKFRCAIVRLVRILCASPCILLERESQSIDLGERRSFAGSPAHARMGELNRSEVVPRSI